MTQINKHDIQRPHLEPHLQVGFSYLPVSQRTKVTGHNFKISCKSYSMRLDSPRRQELYIKRNIAKQAKQTKTFSTFQNTISTFKISNKYATMKFFAPVLLALAATLSHAEEIVFACPDVTTSYYYGACCESFSPVLPNYCINGKSTKLYYGSFANGIKAHLPALFLGKVQTNILATAQRSTLAVDLL